MASITQFSNFKKDIESISLNMFKIQSSLNVLELLDPIPDEIITQISDPELLDVLSNTSANLNKFNELLSKVNKVLHKALYEQKQLTHSKDEPYAGFKVDEKPITGAQIKKNLKNKFQFTILKKLRNNTYKNIKSH